MTKILLLTVVLLLNFSAKSQSTFRKTFGAPDKEAIYRAIALSDGSVVTCGYEWYIGDNLSYPGVKIWLNKISKNGDVLWSKAVGFLLKEEGYNVIPTSDEGFLICGEGLYAVNTNCGTDAFLIKVNSNGDTEWGRGYGGLIYDDLQDAQPTSDGGYILLGKTISFGAGNYDAFLIKLNSDGDTSWCKTYGANTVPMYAEDWGRSVIPTSDNGYIVGGTLYNPSGTDSQWKPWIFKTNSSGTVQWSKIYDAGNSVEHVLDLIKVTGGYATLCNYHVMKIDDNGAIVWAKGLPAGWSPQFGNSFHGRISKTNDGGLVMSGGVGYDASILKVKSTGDLQWARSYPAGGNWDFACSVQQAVDGRYIIGGISTITANNVSDNLLIATDQNGNIGSCSATQTLTLGGNNLTVKDKAPLVSRGFWTSNLSSKGLYSTEVTSNNFTVSTQCQAVFNGVNEMSDVPAARLISENPSDGIFKVEINTSNELSLEVYNVQGKLLSMEKINAGTHDQITIDLSYAPKGLYFLKVTQQDVFQHLKLIVQ